MNDALLVGRFQSRRNLNAEAPQLRKFQRRLLRRHAGNQVA
jgi:hypothetical protein